MATNENASSVRAAGESDVPSGYRAATVTIYTDDTPALIPAFIRDEESPMWHTPTSDGRVFNHARWNGFEIPLFPLDTFTAHADAWRHIFPEGRTEDYATTYAEDGTLSHVTFYGTDPDESEQWVSRVTQGGLEYFTTGDGLVWEEYTPDVPQVGEEMRESYDSSGAEIVAVNLDAGYVTAHDGIANEYHVPLSALTRPAPFDDPADDVWIVTPCPASGPLRDAYDAAYHAATGTPAPRAPWEG